MKVRERQIIMYASLIDPLYNKYCCIYFKQISFLQRYPTPWKQILTSLPFWSVIVAHCGQNWGFFTLMTEMPTYMAKVLNVDLKNVSTSMTFPLF